MATVSPLPGTPAMAQSAQDGQPVITEADEQGFQTWLAGFREQALASGFTEETLAKAFTGVHLNAKVLKADAYQPEFSKAIWDYLDVAASDLRIAQAKEAMADNKALFDQVQAKYKVDSHYVVAIWGLESSFGKITGDYNVFEALATLAYHGRRASFGRTQLMAALEILQTGDKTADAMTGSWAGAMGHGQFIPTTYLTYAVDFDSDGRRDIWANHGDIFASISNYLAQSGWQPDQSWGHEVKLPEGFDYSLADRTRRFSMDAWRKSGVTLANGDPIPDYETPASIIVPAGHEGPAFLILDNFRAILRYNNSTAYALAISQIAERSSGGGAITQSWPRHTKPLGRTERMELQQRLTDQGYDTAGVDGIIGGKTRAAIRTYQKDKGLIADGFASDALLIALRGPAEPSAGLQDDQGPTAVEESASEAEEPQINPDQ